MPASLPDELESVVVPPAAQDGGPEPPTPPGEGVAQPAGAEPPLDEARGAAGGRQKRRQISLGAAILKRISNLSIFRPKKEVDLEEFEVEPRRHRPERLEKLSAATGFSKKEIRFVYRAFKQQCPAGAITEHTFNTIFAKFFPLGDSRQYAHFVFGALDREKSGTITFGDLMLGLSVLVNGSLQQRLRWAFSLYDENNDGRVTKAEMTTVVSAIYDLLGASHSNLDERPEEASRRHVDRVFGKLKLKNDGVITIDEFIDYCSANEDIRRSFTVFDSLW